MQAGDPSHFDYINYLSLLTMGKTDVAASLRSKLVEGPICNHTSNSVLLDVLRERFLYLLATARSPLEFQDQMEYPPSGSISRYLQILSQSSLFDAVHYQYFLPQHAYHADYSSAVQKSVLYDVCIKNKNIFICGGGASLEYDLQCFFDTGVLSTSNIVVCLNLFPSGYAKIRSKLKRCSLDRLPIICNYNDKSGAAKFRGNAC